jgi:hypothetical protein
MTVSFSARGNRAFSVISSPLGRVSHVTPLSLAMTAATVKAASDEGDEDGSGDDQNDEDGKFLLFN